MSGLPDILNGIPQAEDRPTLDNDDSIRQVFSSSQQEVDRISQQLTNEILTNPDMLSSFLALTGAGGPTGTTADASTSTEPDSLSQGLSLLRLLSQRIGVQPPRVVKREFDFGPTLMVVAVFGICARLLLLWDERDMRLMKIQAELDSKIKPIRIVKIPEPTSTLCERSASGDLLNTPSILQCVLLGDRLQCPIAPIYLKMPEKIPPKPGFWRRLGHWLWMAPLRIVKGLFIYLPRWIWRTMIIFLPVWIWRNVIIGPPKLLWNTTTWLLSEYVIRYYVSACSFGFDYVDKACQMFTSYSIQPYKLPLIAKTTDWVLYRMSRDLRTTEQKHGRALPHTGLQIPARMVQFLISFLLWPSGSSSWTYLFTALSIALPFTAYRTYGDFVGGGRVRLLDDRLLFALVPSFVGCVVWALSIPVLLVLQRLNRDSRPAAYGTFKQQWFNKDTLPDYV